MTSTDTGGPRLTAAAVGEVFAACLGEPGGTATEGIVRSAVLDPAKVEAHRTEIDTLLAELPQAFHTSGPGAGGGWSFLNACMDREGNQWGEHPDVELLIFLGLVAGRVTWMLPRSDWSVLPGGMPYFCVTLP